ncbi:hypothetical protein BC830DRAFT_1092069 [Chytriomyces sp. MP71]|nr:hypothetical protein BC830DRAFT_1092069 [Chytriomyces sp. MP71]
MTETKREDPSLELLKSLPPPPTLPQSPAETVATYVLMPFVQGMFYGLGEGVARLLVFRWWGIENFTTIPTAGVTKDTAAKIAASEQKSWGELIRGLWETPAVKAIFDADSLQIGFMGNTMGMEDNEEKNGIVNALFVGNLLVFVPQRIDAEDVRMMSRRRL